jgi:hypothetical protein
LAIVGFQVAVMQPRIAVELENRQADNRQTALKTALF